MEEKKTTNAIAIVGFVFSILSIITLGILSSVGLVLSIIGCAISKKYNKGLKGLSIAGIIISSIFLIFFWFMIISAISSNEPTSVNTSSDNSSITEKYNKNDKMVEIGDFSTVDKDGANNWCKTNNIKCNISEEYNDNVEAGKLISQSIDSGTKVKEKSEIKVIYSLGHKMTDAEIEAAYKAEAKDIDYRDALRNPSSYSGQKVHWYGKVSQVVSNSTIKYYMVYVNCESNRYSSGGILCNDPLYVVYYGDQTLIEDDVVEIWGTMASDSYTYTTVLGASKTVPQVYAKYISIK